MRTLANGSCYNCGGTDTTGRGCCGPQWVDEDPLPSKYSTNCPQPGSGRYAFLNSGLSPTDPRLSDWQSRQMVDRGTNTLLAKHERVLDAVQQEAENKAKRAPSIKAALRLFHADDRVQFLVVGSVASVALGNSRHLGDVDVWLAKPEQIEICLDILGYDIKTTGNIEIPFSHETLHLLQDIDGVDFNDAYTQMRLKDGFPTISDEYNIASKAASGRAKDMADIRTMMKATPQRLINLPPLKMTSNSRNSPSRRTRHLLAPGETIPT